MKRGLIHKNSEALRSVLKLADWAIVALSALLAHRLHLGTWKLSDDAPIILLSALSISVVVFPRLTKPGVRGESIWNQLHSVATAWCVTFVSLSFILQFFALNVNQYSWTLHWFWVCLLTLTGFRFIVFTVLSYFRSLGFNFRKVLVVGAGNKGSMIIRQIQNNPGCGFVVDGIFDDQPELHGSFFEGLPILGTLSDISNYLSKHEIDQVWLALPLSANKKIENLFEELMDFSIEIHIIFDSFNFDLLARSTVTAIAGVPSVVYHPLPVSGINRLLKNFEDKILAFLLIVALSPVMLLIALLIRFTPGPILFRQMRLGWNNENIEIWKFRTMYVSQVNENEMTVQASRDDARITRIGRFLRRSSLDELPQFFNVLQGKMSLVGPRPHAIKHNEFYGERIANYMHRHRVKPGITGWAQVNGWRGETDTLEKMEMRVKHDLYYIKHWSLTLDLQILWMTLFKGFFHKNAY